MNKIIVLLIFIIIIPFLLLWISILFYLLDEIIGGISGVIVACIGTLITCLTVKEFIDYWIFKRFIKISKKNWILLKS